MRLLERHEQSSNRVPAPLAAELVDQLAQHSRNEVDAGEKLDLDGQFGRHRFPVVRSLFLQKHEAGALAREDFQFEVREEMLVDLALLDYGRSRTRRTQRTHDATPQLRNSGARSYVVKFPCDKRSQRIAGNVPTGSGPVQTRQTNTASLDLLPFAERHLRVAGEDAETVAGEEHETHRHPVRHGILTLGAPR